MRAAAQKQGLSIEGSARQITAEDLTEFDWIFCMDQDNYDDVIDMGGDHNKTKLLLSYVGNEEVTEVPDPYFGGDDGFDDVVKLINDAVIKLESMLM
jgi:protein-tyrosine phosphatase